VKRTDFRLYWPIYIIAALLVLFAATAFFVFEGRSRAFDVGAILALRTVLDAAGATWIGETARDITSLGSVVVVCIVAGTFIGYLLLRRERGSAILMLVSAAGGLVLNDVLKMIFGRPRPDLDLPSIRVFTSGFPSGHASLSAAAYLMMAIVLTPRAPAPVQKYMMGVAIFLVFLIGMTRIYLGVHYPTDVLAGWCVGTSWMLTCWTGAKAVENRRSRSGPRQP
jgi:undecaprenyl-diphosphatase